MEVASAVIGTIHELFFGQTDLHCSLPSADGLRVVSGRETWETIFQQLVDNAMQKRVEVQANMSWGALTSSHEVGAHAMSGDEVELESANLSIQESDGLSQFLVVTEQATMNTIERKFNKLHRDEQTKYPRLALLLAQQREVASLVNLWPLLELSEKVRRACYLQVTRDEAQVKTIEEFVRAGCLEQQGIARNSDVEELIQPFAAAWSKCKEAGLMRRLRCKDLLVPPQISKTSPVSLFCVDDRDQGVYLAAAFQSLAMNQNRFVQQLRDAEESGTTLVRDRLGAPIPLQQCQPRHLLSQEVVTNSILRFAVPSRRGLNLDFVQMEAGLEKRLLGGGSMLSMLDAEEIEWVAFSGEAFRHNAEFLEPFRKDPQWNSPLPAAVEKGIRDAKDANLWKDLHNLELIIYYILRAKPDICESLSDFCKSCELEEPSYAKDLQVRHVVPLHNEYEQFEGRRRITNLDDTFRVKLPVGVEQKCLLHWRGNLGELALVALHRLVVRFLETPCSLDISTPCHDIVRLLVDDSGSTPEASRIFDEDWGLTLAHVVCAHATAVQACDRSASRGFQFQ